MRDAVLTLLLMSAAGSLLGLAALLLRRLFWKGTRPVLWYYLWVVVLLRFLLPLPAPVAISVRVPSAVTASTEAPSAQSHRPEVDAGASLPEAPQQAPGAPAALQPPLQAGRAPVAGAVPAALSPAALLLGLWALVAAGRLAHSARQTARFAKLARICGAAAVPELQRLAAETAARMGLRHPPDVLVHRGIDSPLQFGLLRPIVLLPEQMLLQGGQVVRHVLIHEFVHCRRRDALYKWLVQLLVCMHWFNPLSYWFQRRISVDCELSCDAEVLQILCREEHRSYGEMLLSVATALPPRRIPAGSVMLSESAKILKSRLAQIVGYQTKKRPLAALSGGLAALLLCCGFVAGPRLEEQPSHEAPPSGEPAPTVNMAGVIPAADLPEEEPAAEAQTSSKPRPQMISVKGKIDFSVIREHFFGVWKQVEAPDYQVRIGYGGENFCEGYNRVTAAYLDDSGNAVLEILRSGGIHRHIVRAGEPDAIYTLAGESTPDGPVLDYTRTAPAEEPPGDVFGYFDMLEYCLGENPALDLMDEEDTPFHAFYNTQVTLADGSRWVRNANLETPYPTLYLVESERDSITLRSRFYPEGVEPGQDQADTMAEIVFVVAKGGNGWRIRSATPVSLPAA